MVDIQRVVPALVLAILVVRRVEAVAGKYFNQHVSDTKICIGFC